MDEEKLLIFIESLEDYIAGRIREAIERHQNNWHDDNGISIGLPYPYTTREQLHERLRNLLNVSQPAGNRPAD